MRRALRHASSVVAALRTLAPRLACFVRHGYPDRLLERGARGLLGATSSRPAVASRRQNRPLLTPRASSHAGRGVRNRCRRLPVRRVSAMPRRLLGERDCQAVACGAVAKSPGRGAAARYGRAVHPPGAILAPPLHRAPLFLTGKGPALIHRPHRGETHAFSLRAHAEWFGPCGADPLRSAGRGLRPGLCRV